MENNNIIISMRFFKQGPKELYEAFANPNVLTQWFGPAGFSSTFKEFDFREGGRWVFTLHGPDGKDYANESIFKTIEPNKKIVYEHLSNPNFQMTMTFDEAIGGTDLTWEMAFTDQKVRDGLAPIVVPANEENFDRLQQALRLVWPFYCGR